VRNLRRAWGGGAGKLFLALFCGPILLLSLAAPVEPCTLWAAAGERTSHHGTLIGKNRDWAPDQYQELRILAPAGGFRFLVLHPRGARRFLDIAGVNEKGLVVVTAAASCIPKRQRPKSYYREGFLNQILSSCATVDAVIKKQGLLTSPAFYLVADRSRIALIEVGLNEKRSVNVIANGVLCHTNHYLDKNLLQNNQQFKLSSHIRLIQIQGLLKVRQRPLTLQDFITISQDRQDGPDWSIWRQGSSPREVHTLSTWIVSLPQDDAPRLYVKLASLEDPPQTRLFKLDASFWAKATARLWP
jgi:hypothetical protein